MLREVLTQDLYATLLLLCLATVVTARQLFIVRFDDFLAIVWNDRYLKLYTRERKKLDVFNILLFANFVVMASVFCLILYKEFSIESVEDNLILLVLLFGSIAGLLLLKHVIERLIANTFEFSVAIKNYAFYKASHKNLSGLVFLLINILLLFSQLHKKTVIYAAITIFFIINISGFIRFLKVYQKAILAHIFYFLLYLCALEIGPYVILYKVFKDYFV